MARIYDEHLACKNCDGIDFEVRQTITIRSEAAKMTRMENEHYPSRFIEDTKVTYKCVKCGAEL